MTELAPRTKYNADLSAKWMAELKVTARYPKVSQQVELLPLQLNKLIRYGYNGSILEHEGCLLLAYRYHDGQTLSTKIALAQVSFAGDVLSNRTLDIPCDGQSVEDPKLFLWNDNPMVCWVQSTWPEAPPTAVVKYGVIEGSRVVSVHQPAPPKPKPIEKNWCPMTKGTFIYDSEPDQTILTFEGDKLHEEQHCPAPHWPYGAIRGGTPPVPYRGQLLRFFHSGLDNEYDGWRRRYFLGACLHDRTPPFAVSAVSARPIVYGSEIDDLPVSQRGDCPQYKGRVIFPGGAVEHDGHFLVAAGCNDSAVVILKIKPDQLNL